MKRLCTLKTHIEMYFAMKAMSIGHIARLFCRSCICSSTFPTYCPSIHPNKHIFHACHVRQCVCRRRMVDGLVSGRYVNIYKLFYFNLLFPWVDNSNFLSDVFFLIIHLPSENHWSKQLKIKHSVLFCLRKCNVFYALEAE